MISTQHTLRPFADLEVLADAFDGLSLRVGDERCSVGTVLWVSSEEFCSAPVRLELAPDDAEMDTFVGSTLSALEVAGYEAEQVELVVVASSSYLKIVEVLDRKLCSDLGDAQRVLSLTSVERPRALRSPRSGARVDVYLCLATDIERRPLRAWRKGTWLARAHFDLKSDLSGSNFRLRALRDEDRLRLDLPKGVASFVEITEESVVHPSTDESAVTIWLDPQLLARLSTKPGSPAARMFQTLLFLDVVEQVLGSARHSETFWTAAVDDFDGSLFGQILSALTRGKVGQTLDRQRDGRSLLLDLARHEPDRFLADAKASIGTLRATLEALDQ